MIHQSSNEPGTTIVTKELKMEIDAWYLQSSNKLDEQTGQELIEDQLVLSALESYGELAEAGYEVQTKSKAVSFPVLPILSKQLGLNLNVY
jgi:hypothetical protein